jgi:hypothetical protein
MERSPKGVGSLCVGSEDGLAAANPSAQGESRVWVREARATWVARLVGVLPGLYR